jgi:hypothetical protein
MNARLTLRVAHVAESGTRSIATIGEPVHMRCRVLYLNNWGELMNFLKRSAQLA